VVFSDVLMSCLLVLLMCPFPLDSVSHPFIHEVSFMFLILFVLLQLSPYPNSCPAPEFVNLLRNPGNDFQLGGPGRQSYLTYRPAWLHRLVESIPGLPNRLQFRALPVLEFYNNQWGPGTE